MSKKTSIKDGRLLNMDAVDKNIQAFEKVQADLEKNQRGKWVVFHNSEMFGTFDSFEKAADEASKKFDAGSYLIRQVGVSSITLPVSVIR